MSAAPRDVQKVAMQVAAGWGLSDLAVWAHAVEIASAIMAERKRCADIIRGTETHAGPIVHDQVRAILGESA